MSDDPNKGQNFWALIERLEDLLEPFNVAAGLLKMFLNPCRSFSQDAAFAIFGKALSSWFSALLARAVRIASGTNRVVSTRLATVASATRSK